MWTRAWAAYVLDALKGAIAAARSPSPAKTVLLRRVKSCHVFIHLLNCRWSTKLGMTLPEMVFGDTKLEIKNEAQGKEFAYTAYAALDACPRQVDVQVHTQSHTITHNHTHTHTYLIYTTHSFSCVLARRQVSVADAWKATRDSKEIPEAQAFDWTYSTQYRGSSIRQV